MLELSFRERGGPLAVAPDQWRALRLEETVGTLARHGIIRLERTDAAILLFPAHYIGEMRAANVRLTVRPKDRDFYEAVLRLSLAFDAKRATHFENEVDKEAGDNLALRFIRALSTSLEEGVPWQYEQDVEATSHPRGKLHFGRTVSKFLSRGLVHKIFAERYERRQDQSFVGVVRTAYRCLPNTPGAEPSLLQRAAILIEAMDAPSGLSVRSAIDAAKIILTERGHFSDKALDLVRASLSLLEQSENSGHALLAIPSGFASFVNLEQTWERVVARLLELADLPIGSNASLHALADKQIRLFTSGGPVINPDVVVFDGVGEIKIVADAKYKVLSRVEHSGQASDVYQLTCYVDRTRARVGMLVYVGDTDSISELGETPQGGRIFAVRISPERLISHGDQALKEIVSSHGPLIQSAT